KHSSRATFAPLETNREFLGRRPPAGFFMADLTSRRLLGIAGARCKNPDPWRNAACGMVGSGFYALVAGEACAHSTTIRGTMRSLLSKKIAAERLPPHASTRASDAPAIKVGS